MYKIPVESGFFVLIFIYVSGVLFSECPVGFCPEFLFVTELHDVEGGGGGVEVWKGTSQRP